MMALSKKTQRALLETAKKNIASVEIRGDLEPRGNDAEDFLDVSVWGLKAALEAAYELGKKEAQS